MTPRFYRIADLATTKTKRGLLPVSAATIWRWSKEGKLGKPIKLGRAVTCWDAQQIERFIAQSSDNRESGKKDGQQRKPRDHITCAQSTKQHGRAHSTLNGKE